MAGVITQAGLEMANFEGTLTSVVVTTFAAFAAATFWS
jgi:hypothetical protein